MCLWWEIVSSVVVGYGGSHELIALSMSASVSALIPSVGRDL